MRYLILLVSLIYSTASLTEPPADRIGEEFITPIAYPKYNFYGAYSGLRWGLMDHKIYSPLRNTFPAGVGFDVGLYKYFNAGAMLSIALGDVSKTQLPYGRLSLFGRPQITFFDRLSIFSKIGGGLSFFLGRPDAYLSSINDQLAGIKDYFFETKDINAGLNGIATIGIEYFPFSRVGLSVEWGIWADYFLVRHVPSEKWREEDSRERGREGRGSEGLWRDKGKNYGFLSYEFPVMLTLSIIL